MEAQLLAPAEAARYLGISRSYLYGLFKSDALRSVHLGRLRRVELRVLDEFIADLRVHELVRS